LKYGALPLKEKGKVGEKKLYEGIPKLSTIRLKKGKREKNIQKDLGLEEGGGVRGKI